MTTCSELEMARNGQHGEAGPKVLVFACRWCAGIGADGAGRQRLPLPAGFRLISVECVSRIDPDTVLKAFSQGLDGVAVLGCHLDGCRYNRANHVTAKRMAMLSTILESVGIGSDRLLTSFGTAHEGYQFAGLMRRFAQRLQAMPPMGDRERDMGLVSERRVEDA
ncbi:hydrogenase iron-sulfur subunit [Desulfosarcina alkanivorans]|nr:hydrogenase iron-sulfur subunit [Desulfosarcina alkanivorans]